MCNVEILNKNRFQTKQNGWYSFGVAYLIRIVSRNCSTLRIVFLLQIDAQLEERRMQAARDKQQEKAEQKNEKLRIRKEGRARRDGMYAQALNLLSDHPEKIMELMKMMRDERMADYNSDSSDEETD